MSGYEETAHKYDDIIHLPHHQSAVRAHMSLHDRAAQFAPFAALTGYEEAIDETARITDERIVLDETAIERINAELYDISCHLSEKRKVSITYFRPDARKSGGTYLTDIGTVKKVDENRRVLIMDSGMNISMEQIVEIVKM